MKKQILFLAHLPPPHHGSSRVCEIIRHSEVINRQLDITCIDISTETNMQGLGTVSVKKIFRAGSTFIRVMFAYIRYKPNLVHFVLNPHGLSFYRDFLTAEMLKLLGAKIIIHLHSKGIKEESVDPKKKRLYKRTFRRCSVIHLDETLNFDIDAVKDKSMRTYYVPNGIPDEGFGSEIGHKVGKVQLLFLSNLMPSKGAHILLQAINNLPSHFANSFKLVVAGATTESTYTLELQKLAKSQFPDNIEFKGAIYGDKKKKVLEQSDILILPTSNDCFPITILEAMSYSLAVISTFEGAIPSIVKNGDTGALFDVDDVNTLTGIIEKYLRQPNKLTAHQHSARKKFLNCFNLSVFENTLLLALKDELTIVSPSK